MMFNIRVESETKGQNSRLNFADTIARAINGMADGQTVTISPVEQGGRPKSPVQITLREGPADSGGIAVTALEAAQLAWMI